MSTELLPFIADMDRQRETAERAARVAAVHRSFAACWPEWEGPVPGGRCEVGTPIVKSLTHGSPRYHYCAPCIVLSASEDGTTFEVEIDYPPGSICAHYNGERLELDITEIWAPVGILAAARKAARTTESHG